MKALRSLLALLLLLPSLSLAQQGTVNIKSVFDTSNTPVQVGDAANNAIRVNVVAGGGAGGTSSSFAAAFPSTGTAAGARDTSGNMQPFALNGAGTGQNLKVNCSVGCSGGPADESAFTFGTTAIFTGGVFQTTATNNALTNLQAGVFQVTAQRALFANLRDASGTELGILATPVRTDPTGTTTQPVSGTVTANQGATWTVQPGNTPNSTAWLVTGTGGTFPISGNLTGNQATNTVQLGGIAISLNTGVRDTGTQRVTIATDDVVPASQSGTWTVQPGNTANTTAWKVDGSAVTQPVSDASLRKAGDPTALAQGRMLLASVAPTPPVYNRGQLQPLSLTTLGAVRTDSSATFQPTIPRGVSSEGPSPFIFCDQSASISTASSGYTQLVARLGAQAIYVCGYTFVSTSALAVKFAYGTGTNCATGTVDMTGAMAVAANGGVVNPVGSVPTLITLGAQAFCINLSAATQVSGHITYGQF